jgi:TonB family protein
MHRLFSIVSATAMMNSLLLAGPASEAAVTPTVEEKVMIAAMQKRTKYAGPENTGTRVAKVIFNIDTDGQVKNAQVCNSSQVVAVDEAIKRTVEQAGIFPKGQKKVLLQAVLPVHSSSLSIEAVPDIDFGAYMAATQKTIKSHWKPPTGWTGAKVVTTFRVHTDGKLSDIVIKQGSGDKFIDDSAVDALRATQLSPLPKDSPDFVDMKFDFDYHHP